MGNTSAIEGRGTRAAVLGTVIGLVPAIVLGSLPFLLAEDPVVREQLAGNAVFALVYTSPNLLTFMASMEKRPRVRGGLLTAFGLLSFAACFSSMSLVSMALLPATFVIFFAAARSLTVSVRPLAATLLALLAGLFVATAVGLSFFALFFGIEDPEARCWALTMGTDGQPVWESRPNTDGAGSLGVGPLGGSERGVCVSDIISSSEAAVSMGLLATAFMGTLLIATRGRLLCCSRRVLLHFRRGGRPRGHGGVGPGMEAEGGRVPVNWPGSAGRWEQVAVPCPAWDDYPRGKVIYVAPMQHSRNGPKGRVINAQSRDEKQRPRSMAGGALLRL